jgi:hypothetical protein
MDSRPCGKKLFTMLPFTMLPFTMSVVHCWDNRFMRVNPIDPARQ